MQGVNYMITVLDQIFFAFQEVIAFLYLLSGHPGLAVTLWVV